MDKSDTLKPHGILHNRSARILLVANALVLLLAFCLDWSVLEVMFAYWLETFIVAFFSIIKMFHHSKLKAFPAVLLFVLFFSGFAAAHVFLIGVFFGDEVFGNGLSLLAVLSEVATQSMQLWPAVAILFLSHLYSLFVNYFGKYQYLTRSLGFFFLYTYPRLFTLHFALLFGGFMIADLMPYVALTTLFLLKAFADAYTHHLIHFKTAKQRVHNARQHKYEKLFGVKNKLNPLPTESGVSSSLELEL